MGQNYFSSTSELYLFFNLSSNLRLLRLDSNDFKGPFPFNMLENSRSLTVLDIHGNSFNSSTFMLDSLCNLSSLVVLDLSYNLLEGSLPLCLGKLTSLEILNLKMNKFGGKIPNELGDLKELTYLDLSSNSFNSSIPSSLGKLRKLEFLYLGGGNQLYGTVPSTLGQLSGLKELSISGNSLTGEISESHFMKLKLLKYLEFYGFVELIVNPQWIPPFQLRHIYINSVNMGNQFPPWLQTQQNVSLLILRNASISGPVPEWFGTTFSSVTDLDLSMNKMHGVLPSSMKNLRSLADVNLSENKLTGAITEWIGEELSQLQRLRLQSNSFYGVLPSSLKSMTSLPSSGRSSLGSKVISTSEMEIHASSPSSFLMLIKHYFSVIWGTGRAKVK
ncbi:OLC1v1013588C1 [Oldenlandia corymbosa var. corymbosa]|uniref:OLC1v1013588C1 n=1 Tax=Oldenlandia corymbosa var. corymbosa TaxID=529605 RepID=A0AAV1DYV9_OLDCO|nr:OLC1v1013588C1 [Oldenlandia corymbosa var. corymbosa]